MHYSRIAHTDVSARLATHGAVLIEGAKAVGKTTTGLALCASHVLLDRDAAAQAAASADPGLVLDGPPPRLIDEYQLVPGIWEFVRGHVDERRAKGLFVLTGSATPDPDTTSHGGAGRIARCTMRTLSQFERGRSTRRTSLTDLLDDTTPELDNARASVRETIDMLVTGGWPGHADLDVRSALDANADYLDTIVHVDLPRTDGVRRDPQSLMRFLHGYARNVATNASLATIASHGERSLAPNTRPEYVRALERLFLVEDQGAWAPRLRSRVHLSATPKRHLTDASLAIAALGATSHTWTLPPRTCSRCATSSTPSAACSALLVVVADTPTFIRKDGVVVTSLASLGP